MNKRSGLLDLLVPKNKEVLDNIEANPHTYFFHGTRHLDEVKRKGLLREGAFSHASEAEAYKMLDQGHKDYSFSLSSLQDYSKGYTEEELPLIVKVPSSKVDHSSNPALGRNFLWANEYRYNGDIPLTDITFPGSKDYDKIIEDNKYLKKIASDLSIAQKSEGEELKAISDYKDRLSKATDPDLKEAISHARGEEKDHAAKFKKVIEKLAAERKVKKPKSPKNYSHVKDSANATILIDHINKHYETKPGKRGKGKKDFMVGAGKDLAMHHLKRKFNV